MDTALLQLRQVIEQVTPLSDEAWQEMTRLFSPLSLDAEEYFISAGQQASSIAFVISGAMREYFITLEGKEYNKAFIFKGDITGSLFDLLSQQASIASIQATTQTELLVADYQAFSALYDRYPCCQRLGRLQAQHLFMLKARREYEFLTLDAYARYQSLLTKHPDIERYVPQYHIASYLGITPVALSRIKKQHNLTHTPPI
ncbi:MAG: Crp/Fnr family transcriptional regulator [Pseudomonadales bacterium]|nr:Crp/Fnr family transcriptional regulator [Pseudomonadales bacterium]